MLTYFANFLPVVSGTEQLSVVKAWVRLQARSKGDNDIHIHVTMVTPMIT